MKLHTHLLILFALLNGIVLYMFIMHLPFGTEAFLLSLAYWDKLSPTIEIALALGAAVAIIGVVSTKKLSEEWKNRLLYWRWRYPHPACDAFLTTRKQPFGSAELLAKFPKVKDSGFNPQVQLDTWMELYPHFRERPVIVITQGQWMIQRDLYLIASLFLMVFLLTWPINRGVPFNVAGAYVFIYGAQFLFLLFMARRVGLRFVDNLLGTALGLDDSDNGGARKKRNK
jgi:hypothetical protein